MSPRHPPLRVQRRAERFRVLIALKLGVSRRKVLMEPPT
jgi:hypothetical protein